MMLGVAEPDISTDVLIVGAGPAGLVTAAALQAASSGMDFVILEQAAVLGGWPNRVDYEIVPGPAHSLTLFDSNFHVGLPENASATDARAYLTAFATERALEKRVRLGCCLTHLRCDSDSAASSTQRRWLATFEDRELGRPCTAVAHHVVLCTGNSLPVVSDQPPQPGASLDLGLGQVPLPGHVRVLHHRAASPGDLSSGGIVVVGDGSAALDCASAVALLAGGKAVALIDRPVDGSPVSVRPGSSLLDAARRRALQAALQPHSSAPPPSAVGRALIAPTKRRFWAYLKGRAAAALSRSGRGDKAGGSAPGGEGLPSASSAEITDSPEADVDSAEAPEFYRHSSGCSDGKWAAAGDAAATPLEVVSRSRVVLWAPSFTDPRVMPFLDGDVRKTLLKGDQPSPPSSPSLPQSSQQRQEQRRRQEIAQPRAATSGAGGSFDQLALYRGVLHPDLPGLAFVGCEAHASSSLLVLELQAQWLVAGVTARLPLPTPAAMRKDLARQRAWRAAALASPLMSTHGSLAHAYEDHYVRQLLGDLSGLVELRKRPQLQPSSGDGSSGKASRGVFSDRVLVRLLPYDRAAGAASTPAVVASGGAAAAAGGVQPRPKFKHQISCGDVQAVQGNAEDEPLEPLSVRCSPAAPWSSRQRVGIWSRSARTISEPSRSPALPATPRSGGAGGSAGAGAAAGDGGPGGVTGPGTPGPNTSGGPNSRGSNPDLRLSGPITLTSAATATAGAPPPRRHTMAALIFRNGTSDGSGSAAVGGRSVDGRTAEGNAVGDGEQSSCGTASAGHKASTRGVLTSSQVTSLFAEVLESPVQLLNKAVAAAAASPGAESAGAAAATAASPPPLSPAAKPALALFGAPQASLGSPNCDAASGGATATTTAAAAQRRNSATSLPLLKLLPLPRFGQGSGGGARNSGGGATQGPPAAAAAAAANVEHREQPPAAQPPPSPAPTPRWGPGSRRPPPRRSVSFSDGTYKQHALAMQDKGRTRTTTSGGAAAAAAPAAPESLEVQLAVLRSHLLDPRAVPFPRAARSPIGPTAAAVAAAAAAAMMPSPSASAPIVKLAFTTAATPTSPVAAQLLASRCSLTLGEAEDGGCGDGGGDVGEGAAAAGGDLAVMGQRLTTIEERQFLESGSESVEGILRESIDICDDGLPPRRGGGGGGGAAAVWPPLPSLPAPLGLSPPAVELQQLSPQQSLIGAAGAVTPPAAAAAAAGAAATPAAAAAAVMAALAARRRAPPRRSQTTSCLAAPPVGGAGMTVSRAAAPLAQDSPLARSKPSTPAQDAQASPRLRPLFRLSVGAAVATEALMARLASPLGGSGGSAGGDPLRSGPPSKGPPLSKPGSGALTDIPTSKSKLASGAVDKRSPASSIAIRGGATGGDGSSSSGRKGLAALRSGGDGLSSSLGGLLGGAAEAAQVPYSERICDLVAPARACHDPFLRPPRRAMARDEAAPVGTSLPSQLTSPKMGSCNSAAANAGAGAADTASPVASSRAAAAYASTPLPRLPDGMIGVEALYAPSNGVAVGAAGAAAREAMSPCHLSGSSGVGGGGAAGAAASQLATRPLRPEDAQTAHDDDDEEDGLFNIDITQDARADISRLAVRTSGTATPTHGSAPSILSRQLTSPSVPLELTPMYGGEYDKVPGRGGLGMEARGIGGADGDRRGPAWVVRRATQARQEQIVGEVSSWLRDALARRAVEPGAQEQRLQPPPRSSVPGSDPRGASSSSSSYPDGEVLGPALARRPPGRSQTEFCLRRPDGGLPTGDAAGSRLRRGTPEVG